MNIDNNNIQPATASITTTTTSSSTNNLTNIETNRDFKTWNVEQVGEWAKQLKFGNQMATVLEAQYIDGETLISLTDEEIKSILPLGAAKSLISAIKTLNPVPSTGASGQVHQATRVSADYSFLAQEIAKAISKLIIPPPQVILPDGFADRITNGLAKQQRIMDERNSFKNLLLDVLGFSNKTALENESNINSISNIYTE